jgi:tetratricopeptide (TPR) repeat protein
VSIDAFGQAERFVTSGDYGSAKAEYERIIGSESDNSAAWYGLGVVNHAVGDVEAAIVAFERAFLINRFHAPTAANLAFLFSERDSDQASKYAKAAIEQGLSNDELQALASQLIEDKEVPEEEAPVILAKTVPVETESESYNLAEDITSLIKESEFQSAMELISPALEGDYSTDAMIWYYCGLCLHNLDLREDAIQSLNYSLQLDPGLSLASDLVTEIVTKLSEAEQEIIEFTPVATEEVTYAEFNPEEEEDTLEISLEDTLVVLQLKAKDYTQEGNHALAIQTWKKIIQDYGSTYDSWLGMSVALEGAGHVEKASQCKQKAEDLKTKNANPITDEVDVDLVAAAEDAKLSVAQNTPIDEASVNVAIEWYNKGLTLLGEEKGDQALNCFDKAISSTPRDERELRVRSYNGRGHALHQLGKFSESIQSYHQAISMDPTMVTGRTLYNMGSSYAAMEHFADAIKCFQQALNRELDSEEAQLIQTQMNRCSLLLKEQNKSAKLQS